jgi:hypothetical protein
VLCSAACRPPVCRVPRRGMGTACARRRVSGHSSLPTQAVPLFSSWCLVVLTSVGSETTGCYSRCSRCPACKWGKIGLPSSRKDTSTGSETERRPYTILGSLFLLRTSVFLEIFMLVSRALAWLLMVNREAFSGFNVDEVAQYTEKQMSSLRADFGLDLATVRGVVNNACRILEVLHQIARARLPTYFFTSS